MRNYIIVFSSLLFGTASCDQLSTANEKEAGDPYLLKTYYEDGKVKSIIGIDSAKNRHGLTSLYFNSGKLKSEIKYTHGIKEKATQYYENGNKYLELFYKNGKTHGKRTKYWESGKVQSILEYNLGDPMPGLVEYNREGEKLTKYPDLEIRRIDRLESAGKYFIEVYFSFKPDRGTYYKGELIDGALVKGLREVNKVNKRGRIDYSMYAGSFYMEKLNLIGSYRTQYGNPYILTKAINVAF